jgi:hypothetical protein
MIAVILTILILIPAMVWLQESALKCICCSFGVRRGREKRTILTVLSIIVIHSTEVLAFGFAFHILVNVFGVGELYGRFHGEFKDCVYYSFVNFTTLGSGEVTPFGEVSPESLK